jgi:1-acyl-sn-glycerol-3-phosphate acyltransferase
MEIPLAAKNIAVQEEKLPVKEHNYLYRALKVLFRLSTKVYFRKLEVHNIQAIKQDVPLVIVSNHPSAFMDPILLASLLPQECVFLARGEAFNKKLGNIIMHKMNALPVYRDDISPDKIHLNRDTFRKSFKLLDHGKTLFFFPEGVSKTEPRLRPLKKVLARVVFNHAEENNWQKEVCLLPVGISYTDPHSFRTNVAVHFGEPMYVSNWKDMYKESAAKAINLLNEKCRQQLENLSIFIKDESAETVVRQAEKLIGFWEENANKSKLGELNKFATKFSELQEKSPHEADQLKVKADSYFKNLEKQNISESGLQLFEKDKPSYIADLLLFIIGALAGFPVFLYGAINHILPYLLTGFLTNKMTPREDFKGSLRLAAGSFTTIIFYVLQVFAFGIVTGSFWLTLLYIASLPLIGLFAIFYAEWIPKMKNRIKIHRLKNTHFNTYSELINLRRELLNKILLLAK